MPAGVEAAEDRFAHRGEVPISGRPPLPVAVARGIAQGIGRGIAYVSGHAHDLRRPRFESRSVPMPARGLYTAVHAALDELVIGGFQAFKDGLSADDWPRVEAEVEAALGLYEREGWLADPVSYHRSPPMLTDPAFGRMRVLRTPYETMAWSSEWAPHAGEPGRQRWWSYEANRRARALLLRHADDAPRPWLVVVHGAEQGRALIDTNMFRVEYLHRTLGLNVVMPVLPLHGPRRRDTDAMFPSLDLLDNVHGLAQAAFDVRRTLSWVRTQAPLTVGLMGFSLGTYTSALVAGLEADLDCVIGGGPAVDFPALFRRNATRAMREQPRFRILMEQADLLHRVVSPLAFPPLPPTERLFLHAGLADRLAHPIDQAAELWHHWGRPTILWHGGGHLGHRFVGSVGAFIDDVVRRTLVVGASTPDG